VYYTLIVRAVPNVATIGRGYDNPFGIPGLVVTKLWSTKFVLVVLKHYPIRMLFPSNTMNDIGE
jgi:hypothetical protein